MAEAHEVRPNAHGAARHVTQGEDLVVRPGRLCGDLTASLEILDANTPVVPMISLITHPSGTASKFTDPSGIYLFVSSVR